MEHSPTVFLMAAERIQYDLDLDLHPRDTSIDFPQPDIRLLMQGDKEAKTHSGRDNYHHEACA
jgi:hypothetical protein